MVFLTDKSVLLIFVTVKTFKDAFINGVLYQKNWYQGDQQNSFCHAKLFKNAGLLPLEVRSVVPYLHCPGQFF